MEENWQDKLNKAWDNFNKKINLWNLENMQKESVIRIDAYLPIEGFQICKN